MVRWDPPSIQKIWRNTEYEYDLSYTLPMMPPLRNHPRPDLLPSPNRDGLNEQVSLT